MKGHLSGIPIHKRVCSFMEEDQHVFLILRHLPAQEEPDHWPR